MSSEELEKLNTQFQINITQLKTQGQNTKSYEREFDIYSKYALDTQISLKNLLIREISAQSSQELNAIRIEKRDIINRYFNQKKEEIIQRISSYRRIEPLRKLIEIDNSIQDFFNQLVGPDEIKTDLFLLGIEVYRLQENTLLWLSGKIVPGSNDDVKRLLDVMLNHLIVMDQTIETIYRENIS